MIPSFALFSATRLHNHSLLFLFLQMSKLVNGDNARGMDLVDGISSADVLTTTACHWAKDILAHRRPWTVSLYRTDWLEPLPEAKMMLEHARVKSKKQAPNLKHPLVCIDVIEELLVHGPRAALWKVLRYGQFLVHIANNPTGVQDAILTFYRNQRHYMNFDNPTLVGV